MAYRFNGSSDRVEFAIAPLSGYTFGAATFASLFKRTTLAVNHFLIWMTDANGSTNRVGYYVANNDIPQATLNGTAPANAVSLPSATTWYLLAVTWTAASATPRVHLFNGTSWNHANADSALGSSFTPDGSTRLAFGAKPDGSFPFAGDAVCAGVKKTNSTDLQIETLSSVAFQKWRDFGFDWMVGFDSSLVSGGVLQDQASSGTGDQIAINGTSLVSDPPGWLWTGLPTPPAYSSYSFPSAESITRTFNTYSLGGDRVVRYQGAIPTDLAEVVWTSPAYFPPQYLIPGGASTGDGGGISIFSGSA